MRKIIKLSSNKYLQQISTLVSGTLFAQLINLALIPVVTRFYSPSEFGAYSIFISTIGIVGLTAGLKYDQALILPKKEEDANSLAVVAVISTIVVALLLLIIVMVASSSLVGYFNNNYLHLYLIPVGVLLVSLLQLGNAYSVRKHKFKLIASVKVVNALSLSPTQAGSKYFLGLNGLVAGKILADTISLIILARAHIKGIQFKKEHFQMARLLKAAKTYSNFPKFQAPTVLVNSISQHMPIFFLAFLFTPEIAGLYALTVRFLQAPVGLIGSAARDVYYRHASINYANSESFLQLYSKTTIVLTIIFMPFLAIIYYFGPDIFSILFGETWRDSGDIAKILVPAFLMAFVCPPSIATYSILGLQHIQFKLEILSLLGKALAIYCGFKLFNSHHTAIIFYTVIVVMTQLILITIIQKKIKQHATSLTGNSN